MYNSLPFNYDAWRTAAPPWYDMVEDTEAEDLKEKAASLYDNLESNPDFPDCLFYEMAAEYDGAISAADYAEFLEKWGI